MSASSSATTVVGKPRPRVDGPQKVTGGAKYTSDFHLAGMLYAVPVGATRSKSSCGDLPTFNVRVKATLPFGASS